MVIDAWWSGVDDLSGGPAAFLERWGCRVVAWAWLISGFCLDPVLVVAYALGGLGRRCGDARVRLSSCLGCGLYALVSVQAW